jgi:hypothetical protein
MEDWDRQALRLDEQDELAIQKQSRSGQASFLMPSCFPIL